MSYLVIPPFFTFGEEYADKQYFQSYRYKCSWTSNPTYYTITRKSD
jgi:hypothetical protein